MRKIIFNFLVLFLLASSFTAYANLSQDSFIQAVEKLMKTCNTMSPQSFSDQMDRLNVDFVRVIGLRSNTKNFRLKKKEVQDVGMVFFPHSLPSGKYDSQQEREFIPLRDGYSVCDGEQMDLLEAMKTTPNENLKLKDLKNSFLDCMRTQYFYETEMKNKLLNCYSAIIPN